MTEEITSRSTANDDPSSEASLPHPAEASFPPVPDAVPFGEEPEGVDDGPPPLPKEASTFTYVSEDEEKEDRRPAEPARSVDPHNNFAGQIQSGIQVILAEFEQKLKFDAFKEQQIERMHQELQEYKRDLLAKATRPLIGGMIRLHDNLGKALERMLDEEGGNAEDGYVSEVLTEFREDVEILLEQNGVALFVHPEDKFEPLRQTCRRNVETDDEDLVGTVAVRIQSGFELHEQLLQKEKVGVFIKSKHQQQAF